MNEAPGDSARGICLQAIGLGGRVAPGGVVMAIQGDEIVEVERDGSTHAIRFTELRLGDTFAYVGERWHLETYVRPFCMLDVHCVFHYRGRWFIKHQVVGFASHTSPCAPFGVATKDASYFHPAIEVGALTLKRIK